MLRRKLSSLSASASFHNHNKGEKRWKEFKGFEHRCHKKLKRVRYFFVLIVKLGDPNFRVHRILVDSRKVRRASTQNFCRRKPFSQAAPRTEKEALSGEKYHVCPSISPPKESEVMQCKSFAVHDANIHNVLSILWPWKLFLLLPLLTLKNSFTSRFCTKR